MSISPDPEQVPATPGVEQRVYQIRAGLSGAATVLLLAGAVLAFLTSYAFFTVVLAVLAVCTGVDLRWALRRMRRSG